jgi:hypothetical protein
MKLKTLILSNGIQGWKNRKSEMPLNDIKENTFPQPLTSQNYKTKRDENNSGTDCK